MELNRIPTYIILRLICAGFIITLLAACAAPTGVPTSGPGVTPSSQNTSAPPATDTPTPPMDQTILWIPEGADPALAASMRKRVSELAGGVGMKTVEVASLSAAEMKAHWRFVFALQPAAVPELAASFTGSRYVLVTTADVPAMENLGVIRIPELQQAFLAGYTAAMAADQWKTGVLSRADTASGPQIRDAFMSGVRYLCGNCAPRYDSRLPLNYPVYAEAAPDTWQTGLEALKAQGVLALYMDPSLERADLLAAVVAAGMHLVTGLPAPENYEGPGGLLLARVLIDLETPLQEIFQEMVIAHQPGLVIDAGLSVQEVNNNLISAARMRLVDETRLQLETGWIFPGQAAEKPEPDAQ